MKLLFIGSAVADVLVRLPRLPQTGDDLAVQSQRVTLGGCAANACRAALALGADAALFAPVGTGIWGDFVRKALAEAGLHTLAPAVDQPNGCCYCLVEPDGDRSFLCEHGAEYRMTADMLSTLNSLSFDAAYFCGLELEEDTADDLLTWFEAHRPGRLYFSPGPRLTHLKPERMARALSLRPTLHLSEREATIFASCPDAPEAADRLYSLTEVPVIITLGAEGAWIRDKTGGSLVSGFPAMVRDTVGAGDAHIGAVMAMESQGMPLREAVREANRYAAQVVSREGA